MNNWIIPNWPAPHNVKSLFTTRTGGFSTGNNAIYASLNLGAHVNDNWVDVERNRTLLRRYLPNDPKKLSGKILDAFCKCYFHHGDSNHVFGSSRQDFEILG